MLKRFVQFAAACALALAASPALAGLDFADNLTVGGSTGFNGAGTDVVTYTFSGTTYSAADLNALNGGTGVALPGSFVVGPDIVTVGAQAGTSTTNFLTSSLDFAYTGNTGHSAANYVDVAGTPPYNLVVQLGSVTVAPGAALQLASVEFGEGGVFSSNSFTISRNLTSLDAGTVLFLEIDTAQVPAVDRDLVDIVRLNFIFTGGAGTSFAVQAVANPEPGTFALFGLGIAGLGFTVLRRRKRKAALAADAS